MVKFEYLEGNIMTDTTLCHPLYWLSRVMLQ